MPKVFEADTPMNYAHLSAALRALKKNCGCMQCFPLTKSVLGRPVTACILGQGLPGLLLVGSHHALEYITSMLLMRFLEETCDALATGAVLYGVDVKAALARRPICVVPMLNPDGVELHLRGIEAAGLLREPLLKASGGDFSGWQANAHGVDLNHNYNAGWQILRQMEAAAGIMGPAPRRFGGPAPESEPETHALCNLCRRIPFERAYALHSQGEEIYWDYGRHTPKISEEIAQRLAQISGYTVSQPEGLASHGGFKDWFIRVFCRPAFTLEVGRGQNPLPLSDFDAIYEKLAPMLFAALVL